MKTGAADLDGVIHSGLQVKKRPGFSRHGPDLETQKPKTVGGVRESKGSLSSPLVLSLPARLDDWFRESIGPRIGFLF